MEKMKNYTMYLGKFSKIMLKFTRIKIESIMSSFER